MEKYKFQVGQKVVYEGLIGIIENRSIYSSNIPHYGLVSEQDKELTCTAAEHECEAYMGEEIDESDALQEAKESSMRIRGMVDGITDKYYGDGSF